MASRLQQLRSHLASQSPDPHPFDPLSSTEIEYAIAIIRSSHQSNASNSALGFNAVTLSEPKKAEMLAWLANPSSAPRPRRQAEVVAVDKESKVYDGIVDLVEGKVLVWEKLEGVQPLVCLISSPCGVYELR
jgi:primary-amine oxidase